MVTDIWKQNKIAKSKIEIIFWVKLEVINCQWIRLFYLTHNLNLYFAHEINNDIKYILSLQLYKRMLQRKSCIDQLQSTFSLKKA